MPRRRPSACRRGGGRRHRRQRRQREGKERRERRRKMSPGQLAPALAQGGVGLGPALVLLRN